MEQCSNRLTRLNAHLPTLDALGDDLRRSSTLHRTVSALLPLATAALFALACALGWYWLLPLIVLAHFVFAVSYLHDVAHGSAGLNGAGTHAMLFVIGTLMLQSGHAFRYTHLFHHTHCLEDDDIEGAPARMALWQVLLCGPAYLPGLWARSLRDAGLRERRWIVAELVCGVMLVAGAVALAQWSVAPLLYCVAVYVGGWGYPLATAYLPHYKPGSRPLEQARTMRGAIVPVLFMNLTYHLEHHLYPQVPGTNLRRLAMQLDPLLAARGFRPTYVL
jgi:beta-carotene hydroxylase